MWFFVFFPRVFLGFFLEMIFFSDVFSCFRRIVYDFSMVLYGTFLVFSRIYTSLFAFLCKAEVH